MNNRYSLDRREKKLAGVCSTIGDIFNVDPTIVRLGFVAVALLVKWEVALIAYIAAGIYFHMKRKQADGGHDRRSDFDRMEDVGRGRSSVHALRTQLDTNDRRMMAIDQHLNSQNDELAREIEALREGK